MNNPIKLALLSFLLCPGLQADQPPCWANAPGDRLWAKFDNSSNPFSRHKVLGSLVDKNRPTDIPIFIKLLNCDAPLGREGDTVQEFLIDQLQRSVPIEYEGFILKRFADDPEYRLELKRLYTDWWLANKSSVVFNKPMNCFCSSPTKQSDLEKHSKWYLGLVASRA